MAGKAFPPKAVLAFIFLTMSWIVPSSHGADPPWKSGSTMPPGAASPPAPQMPESRPNQMYKGSPTDITGLRLEDVAGSLRNVLDETARSLRLSNLPLQEVQRLQKEIHKAAGHDTSSSRRWLEAGNLAKFNGLRTEPYITIPVDVNLIFIGFSGNGHYRLSLMEDELKPWFEHMEHKMAHTMIPLNEESTGKQRTHVYYRYNFHVLELHPDVDAIIEAVIWDNARPEDPWTDEGLRWTAQDMHQVDILPVENALEDLVDTLQLNSSYTLFLMNPKLPFPDFNYGYRHGFSEAELRRLHNNDTLVSELLRREKSRPLLKMSSEMKEDVHLLRAQVAEFRGEESAEKMAELQRQKARLDQIIRDKSAEQLPADYQGVHGAAQKPGPRGRPKYTDMRDLSQAWAAIYKQAIHDLSYWQRHPAEEPEDELEVDDIEAEAAYRNEIKTLLSRPKDKALPADMLFEVMATRMLQSDQDQDRQYIRNSAQDRHTQEDCLTDNWVANSRFAFIDFSAGPFEWGPIVGGKGVRSFRTIPDIVSLKTAATDFTVGGKWHDPEYVSKVHADLRAHGLERLEEEKQMLLVFLRSQCEGRTEVGSDAGNTCQELRHKLSAVEAFIRSHTSIASTDEETLQHLSLVTGGPHEGANISLVQHSMFAKLGAIIETTQRQLFTPSVSQISAPYKSQFYFHVYIVTNHDTFKPDAKKNFDFEKFQAEINQFKLPRQQFHFVLHKYSMADDHALAVAYANALRSAVVATLKVDGRFVATKRMYLDSQVLEKHLQLLHDHMAGGGPEEAGAMDKRDIPIFLFSMDAPLPVFIDKHYQAKALQDMVIAVQSDEVEWDSHLACNGKPVVWNLRNPLRPLLAATVQHMAGVMPMHLNMDEGHGKVSQDWLWSVGCSPLSHTATHTANFSQLHVDTAHRNFVAQDLALSLKLANEGVAALTRASTNRDNADALPAVPNDRLVQMHVAIKLSWKSALTDIRKLDFQSAIPHVHTAVRNARHFKELAEQTEQLLMLSSCLSPLYNQPFDWGMVLMVAAAVGCVALYYLLVPVKSKAKIN